MQIFDYIRQRMHNMGFNPDDVVIEPHVEIFSGERHIIEATNVYYYLYDLTEYTNTWNIESDTEILNNKKFILDERMPYGIVELTGNIEITSELKEGNKFMFYKATPGSIQLKIES